MLTIIYRPLGGLLQKILSYLPDLAFVIREKFRLFQNQHYARHKATTLAASKTTDDQRSMGFVRAGWSKGSAPIYNETYTLGVVRRVRRNSDEVGIAVNWGDLPDSSLGSQTTGEFFYRLQWSQGIAITPSVQLLKDPALNPGEDTVWVWGIRFRLTL